jgi:transposase
LVTATCHTAQAADPVLKACGTTSVALEATGVYGHVLDLTLLEASLPVVVISARCTKHIQGRPNTDRRDCQWIQRLHTLGLLPAVFQPDDATHTLGDYVRQRANLVRLSGQHVQRMHQALELMNLRLTAQRAGGAVPLDGSGPDGHRGDRRAARVDLGDRVGL